MQVRRLRTIGVARRSPVEPDTGLLSGTDAHLLTLSMCGSPPGAELMVDANGGYSGAQARRVGAALDALGVSWFEEPVSSDDTEGLANLRASLRCDIAAGEYAADMYDVQALLPDVDCLQLDAARCGGYMGWLPGAALAAAQNLQVSAHGAPSLHAFVGAAIPNLRQVEWFADHARLEPLLVDGVPIASGGGLHVNLQARGHGMTITDGAKRWRD